MVCMEPEKLKTRKMTYTGTNRHHVHVEVTDNTAKAQTWNMTTSLSMLTAKISRNLDHQGLQAWTFLRRIPFTIIAYNSGSNGLKTTDCEVPISNK